MFEKIDWSERGKHLKKYIWVIVAVELNTVGGARLKMKSRGYPFP